jgi:drug/metabolite transporter (DMT)-like permease
MLDIMKLITFKSDFILLFVAGFWVMAFVAQRMGMDHIGPFTFNSIRFTIGCISLLPLVMISKKKPSMTYQTKDLIKSGILADVCLFCGISFQQVSLVYTSAGKARFITGLYVIIVPILGLFLKRGKTSIGTWTGTLLATSGMYFLSVTQNMQVNIGDILVLISTICFAFHLIVIDSNSN